jgi:hypothetical protein
MINCKVRMLKLTISEVEPMPIVFSLHFDLNNRKLWAKKRIVSTNGLNKLLLFLPQS